MNRSFFCKLSRWSAVGLVALGTLSGCASTPPAKGTLNEVSVSELKEVLEQTPDILLVEVRTQPEYEATRAIGIKKYIVHTEMAERHNELGVSKDTPIYVICRSGRRSGIAGQALVDLGYTRVYNVLGGTNAWVEAGFPTESGPVTAQ